MALSKGVSIQANRFCFGLVVTSPTHIVFQHLSVSKALLFPLGCYGWVFFKVCFPTSKFSSFASCWTLPKSDNVVYLKKCKATEFQLGNQIAKICIYTLEPSFS